MPLETNSDEWGNSEEVDADTDKIFEFLKDNPDKAFHIKEISDEVLNTRWEGDEEPEPGDTQKILMTRVWLDHLVRESKIKARKVPKDQDHLPREGLEYLLYYSYRSGGLGSSSSDE